MRVKNHRKLRIKEDEIPEDAPEQLNLFVDYEALEQKKEAEKAADDRERRIQKATLELQARYGKNALLKGLNLLDGATTIMRNGQIGGHRAGDGRSASNSSAPTMDDVAETADNNDGEDGVGL